MVVDRTPPPSKQKRMLPGAGGATTAGFHAGFGADRTAAGEGSAVHPPAGSSSASAFARAAHRQHHQPQPQEEFTWAPLGAEPVVRAAPFASRAERAHIASATTAPAVAPVHEPAQRSWQRSASGPAAGDAGQPQDADERPLPTSLSQPLAAARTVETVPPTGSGSASAAHSASASAHASPAQQLHPPQQQHEIHRIPSLGSIASAAQARDPLRSWYGAEAGAETAPAAVPSADERPLPALQHAQHRSQAQRDSPAASQRTQDRAEAETAADADGSVIIHADAPAGHLAERRPAAAPLPAAAPDARYTTLVASAGADTAQSGPGAGADVEALLRTPARTPCLLAAQAFAASVHASARRNGTGASASQGGRAGSVESHGSKLPTPHRLEPAARLARVEAAELAALRKRHAEQGERLARAEATLDVRVREAQELRDDRDGWLSEAARLEEELAAAGAAAQRAAAAHAAAKSAAASARAQAADAAYARALEREARRAAAIELALCRNEATYAGFRADEARLQLAAAKASFRQRMARAQAEALELIETEKHRFELQAGAGGDAVAKLSRELEKVQRIAEAREKEIEALKQAVKRAAAPAPAPVPVKTAASRLASANRGPKFVESSSPPPVASTGRSARTVHSSATAPASSATSSSVRRAFAVHADPPSSARPGASSGTKVRAREPMQGASEPSSARYYEQEADDSTEAPASPPPPRASQQKAAAATASARNKRVYREDDDEDAETPDEDADDSADNYRAAGGAAKRKRTAPAEKAATGGKASVLSRAKAQGGAAAAAAAAAALNVERTPMLVKTKRAPFQQVEHGRAAGANGGDAAGAGAKPAAKGGAFSLAAGKDAAPEAKKAKARAAAADDEDDGALLPAAGAGGEAKKKRRKLLGGGNALTKLAMGSAEATSSLNPSFALPLELSPVKPTAPAGGARHMAGLSMFR